MRLRAVREPTGNRGSSAQGHPQRQSRYPPFVEIAWWADPPLSVSYRIEQQVDLIFVDQPFTLATVEICVANLVRFQAHLVNHFSKLILPDRSFDAERHEPRQRVDLASGENQFSVRGSIEAEIELLRF